MKLIKLGGFAGVLIAGVLGITLSVTGFGEDATALKTEAAAAPPQSKVFGTLDLRAEYLYQPGGYDTSNYAQIGYQFNPDLKVSWYQGFDTNISKSLFYHPNGGFDFISDQSFLRTRISNIWKSGNLSLAYESRIYAPTWNVEAAQGNITRLYNAIKFIDEVSKTVTLTAVAVVAPQIFRVAGTPAYGANPWLENRFYLVADFNITPKLTLDLPILLYQDRYRDYAVGAANNNTWGYILYTWPELDYAINDNLTLGLAFVSDNMIKSDFSGFTLGKAFQNGLFQFVVTASI